MSLVEYLWIDGSCPTQQIRSKTRVVDISDTPCLQDFPEWGFDGSSTNQAKGSHSDLVLKPVFFCPDPIRGEGNFIVLNEVFSPENQVHQSNTRAQLRSILERGANLLEPLVGFEQEYTLFSGRNPLGWPEDGFPPPQGPFYCGVGTNRVFGRELVEEHLQACIDAGLSIYGVNAEVMPGQWEFQIGYRGFTDDTNEAITFSDHLIIARWLLRRIAEEFNITVSFHNKPVTGDWNGAGCHTNFSTKAMREESTGKEAIYQSINALEKKHQEHVAVYGYGLERRLTGLHETCSIQEFRWGVADRGASIRIPLHVENKGFGYIEDRRPGANCDPYLVVSRLLATTMGLEQEPFKKNDFSQMAENELSLN